MRQALLIVLFFNAFTAIGGGLALIVGWIDMSQVEIHPRLFTHLAIPGTILSVVVGGSALVAGVAFLKHMRHAALLALASGIIMEIWIISEMYFVVHFSWLQILYLLTGLAVVILSVEWIIRHLDTQTNRS